MAHLEAEYDPEMDLQGGVGLALEAMAEATEDGLDSAGMHVATVDVESEQFTTLSTDEVESHLEERDINGDDE
jgi:proteasome alpha subunit